MGDEYDESKMTVGTHTLRKTGFLFAVFGTFTRYNKTGIHGTKSLLPMDDCAISSAARHEQNTDAKTYYQDAMTRYEEIQMDENLKEENELAPWKSNFVLCETTRKTLSLDSRYDKTLDKLADDYVARELLVDAGQVEFVTYEQLIERALKWNTDNQTFKEKFDQLVEKKNLPEDAIQELWLLFRNECVANRLHYAGAIAGVTGGDDDVGEWTLWSFYLSLFVSHALFPSSKNRPPQNRSRQLGRCRGCRSYGAQKESEEKTVRDRQLQRQEKCSEGRGSVLGPAENVRARGGICKVEHNE